jgi:hypothetical protein
MILRRANAMASDNYCDRRDERDNKKPKPVTKVRLRFLEKDDDRP